MDFIKVAKRIALGFKRDQGHTRAAHCAAEEFNGYAVVANINNLNLSFFDEKNLLNISNIPEDISGPVIFDCHPVSILCKGLLEEINKRDLEIEKLKDSTSYYRKTGLAKLSDQEKIALGLKFSDIEPVLARCKSKYPEHEALYMKKSQLEDIMNNKIDIFIQMTEDGSQEIRRVSAKNIRDPNQWYVPDYNYSEYMVMVYQVE